MAKTADESTIATFVDLENVAIGARDARLRKLDIGVVLARLVEKGKIVVKRAYADWTDYKEYKRPLHEAGIELIDIPRRASTGKNSADIKMVVDALEMAYSKTHIDTFALITGDSDFTPLVAKLRENNKRIIGVGVKNSTSRLLIDSCDEFIYYDDLVRKPARRSSKVNSKLPEKKREAFVLLLDVLAALQRENKEVLWSSMIKDTMKRKQPQFNEEYHGYSSFGRLLEDAEANKLIKLRRDDRSGTYVVDEVLEEDV